jgi:hypothetical protein
MAVRDALKNVGIAEERVELKKPGYHRAREVLKRRAVSRSV